MESSVTAVSDETKWQNRKGELKRTYHGPACDVVILDSVKREPGFLKEKYAGGRKKLDTWLTEVFL